MNRLYESGDFSSSCSSDSDDGSTSDDDSNELGSNSSNGKQSAESGLHCRKPMRQNVLLKLQNRERTGYFTDKLSHTDKKQAFVRVPNRLKFCLKEIVPYCYLTGHVFMGLTICGQFMLSYKVISDEDSTMSNYSFTSTYKYELYFWIYRPHNMLYKYFTVCLFDDHGVDNIKTVTMSQWKSNTRSLIVHGSGGCESEDSYITIVAVPNLGCLDCKAIRDEFDAEDVNRSGYLCIKCNFTIHTKYCRADTDPIFRPDVNLQCVDRILIVANGFIHMVSVDLSMNKQSKPFANTIDAKYVRSRARTSQDADRPSELAGRERPEVADSGPAAMMAANESRASDERSRQHADEAIDDLGALRSPMGHQASLPSVSPPLPPPPQPQRPPQPPQSQRTEPRSIVEKIIADFAEFESETLPTDKQSQHQSRTFSPTTSAASTPNNFNELIIMCRNSSSIESHKPNSPAKVRLLNHRGSRIITKNMNVRTNSITTIELGAAVPGASTNKNLDKAAKAYEFSEDNEKCEKISTFRKRRLADRKYEFSEDNTENIIPYNRMRAFIRSPKMHQKMAKQSASASSLIAASPPNYELSPSYHTHRASPSYGFRSPCGSPVGNRFIMVSPPSRSCLTSKSPSRPRSSAMSPRASQQPNIKRHYYDAIMDPHSLVLSPRSDECDAAKMACINFPLSEVKPSNIDLRSVHQTAAEKAAADADDKPMCSIKLIRHYVEEDDAASVITSEEDDCISPGYHTSLPLEVHGAGYSDMQMISKNSYRKLMCPTIIVTQLTFDLEAFTYYAVNYLCSINNKKYGFFYDCGCEIVKICPLSCMLTCILMVNFTASDLQPVPSINNCINCTSNLNLECMFHRKHYECQILFTWDTDSGEWHVLDYGHLLEVSPSLSSEKHTPYIHRIVSKLAADMISGLTAHTEIFGNLHVLDSCVEKSKKVLRDVDNSIEFYRTSGQIRYSYDSSDYD